MAQRIKFDPPYWTGWGALGARRSLQAKAFADSAYIDDVKFIDAFHRHAEVIDHHLIAKTKLFFISCFEASPCTVWIPKVRAR